MTTKHETKAKEEYKNDRVEVTVNRKPYCVVEYEISASPALVIEAQKKAARSVGKEVVVPGFRKGKAPIEIVAKRYPAELDRRWQEGIANTAYREAAELANIPLVRQDAQIGFTMHSHSREGSKLTISFETIPNVPSIDPAKCVLDAVKRPEVNEEKVDETIRQAQLFFAEWKMAEDRPIKEGDFVLLDVDIIEQEPHKKLFANTRFEVTDRAMAQWMKKLILGKKAGETLEGVSIPDESLSDEEKKQFPPKKMRVSIKAIEEATLPELNDEFVKQLGVDTVANMKKRVEELLTKKADEHVRELQREQVTDFLLSHPFEIPNSVIEKETQFRMQQMIQEPSFKAKWDASNENEKRDLIDNVKKQAERAVRIFYICRKISLDQKISISPKDVTPASQDVIESLLYPNADPHDPRQPEVKQAEEYSRILLEKTEDWVITHARTASSEKKEKEETPKKKKAAAPKAKEEKPKEAEPKKKKAAPSKEKKEKKT